MKAPSKSKTIVNLRTFLFIVNLYTVAFILLKVQIKNNLTSDINKKMRLGKISSASGLQGSKSYGNLTWVCICSWVMLLVFGCITRLM